ALVGKGQLAARIDNPADNHRQSGSDPGFIARIKHLGQFQFLGQLEQGMAGAVFARGKDLESPGRVYGDNLAAEGGLQEFEFVERKAADAAVVGVLDLAVEAEGGTDEAV